MPLPTPLATSPGASRRILFPLLLACGSLLQLGSWAPTAGSSPAAPPAVSPAGTVRLAPFDWDATPPVGSRLAYDPATNTFELGLRARGVVLLGAGEPIVLCAVDWIGIANEGHDAFRDALARAAGTRRDRVSVHVLHQHDAPDCDFSAERLLRDAGQNARQYEGGFQRQVISNLAAVVARAIPGAQPVTHVALGEARVHDVASNRRILGPNGKVRTTRYTATKDPAVRAEPEGTIDPMVSLVSFWNSNAPLAVLTYYATHPQSYYRTGLPNPDFPGLARFLRQLAVPEALHVHFNGAGGNLGAGKYNDGARSNRLALAERLADGMKRAWLGARRVPVTPATVDWRTEPVALPVSPHLVKAAPQLEAALRNPNPDPAHAGAASRLSWLHRCQAGHRIDVGCLAIGDARILHLPGELFVEYQLAAKATRPGRFVAVAAYGDYAPWYIGTAEAYEEGGYETDPNFSNVAPEVENVLTATMSRLLLAPDPGPPTPGR